MDSEVFEDMKDNRRINKTIHYDRSQQRVWLGGRRLHHGLTGIVLALVGGALMAHDWKDRSVWLGDHSQVR